MTQGADTFAGAPTIHVGGIGAATPTTGLSMELEDGEPTYPSAFWTMSRSAWWKFVATADADISVNLFHSEGVPDWDTLNFAMVSVYTGTTLDTLTRVAYATSSDQYETSGLSNSPEVTIHVTAGTTYRVQALLQDTAADISYRIQVAEYAETWTDWVQESDYTYEVPRSVDADGDLIANMAGNSKMFDQIETILSAYVVRPNPSVLKATKETAQALAWDNPVNNAWSTESAFVRGEVGDHPPLEGGEWWEEDTTKRRYGASYREYTYAYRDYDALLSHEYQPVTAPEGGLWYEWEGIERSQVLEADVQIQIRTYSEQGTVLDGFIAPSTMLHEFEVYTSSTYILDPMPLVSNDNTASSLSGWDQGHPNVKLQWVPMAAVDTTLWDINMNDYINTDGTFVLAARVKIMPWIPEDETGYAGYAKAELKVAQCTYLVRPPRRRFLVRTYSSAAAATTTYRRNYPRDDGLAGGARRNYPPSKAMQSGNRNVGGYL